MNFEDYNIVEQKNNISKDSPSLTKIIENKEDLEKNKEDLEKNKKDMERIINMMVYMENEKKKIIKIRRRERELELLEKQNKKGGNINNEELIKQKYLKYKIKYLKLKNA